MFASLNVDNNDMQMDPISINISDHMVVDHNVFNKDNIKVTFPDSINQN